MEANRSKANTVVVSQTGRRPPPLPTPRPRVFKPWYGPPRIISRSGVGRTSSSKDVDGSNSNSSTGIEEDDRGQQQQQQQQQPTQQQQIKESRRSDRQSPSPSRGRSPSHGNSANSRLASPAARSPSVASPTTRRKAKRTSTGGVTYTEVQPRQPLRKARSFTAGRPAPSCPTPELPPNLMELLVALSDAEQSACDRALDDDKTRTASPESRDSPDQNCASDTVSEASPLSEQATPSPSTSPEPDRAALWRPVITDRRVVLHPCHSSSTGSSCSATPERRDSDGEARGASRSVSPPSLQQASLSDNVAAGPAGSFAMPFSLEVRK
jgi:hypothetical protein